MKALSVNIPDGIYLAFKNASEKEKESAMIAIENLLKIRFVDALNRNLLESSEAIRQESSQNGLTNQMLDELLKEIDNESRS
ncbi:hypothetical protein [Arcicella rosea]|uniref:Uncharacterized protein n=1 Tax=Arcicella rosea TaxID=502909 RepID=A0A841ELX6_9BACT|nr:hypothetical protein [Arcicella rosea]MBB6004195.1 hypothetical protein [Arcicella rosea]